MHVPCKLFNDIEGFGIHFVAEMMDLANHKAERLNQVKTQTKYT